MTCSFSDIHRATDSLMMRLLKLLRRGARKTFDSGWSLFFSIRCMYASGDPRTRDISYISLLKQAEAAGRPTRLARIRIALVLLQVADLNNNSELEDIKGRGVSKMSIAEGDCGWSL